MQNSRKDVNVGSGVVKTSVDEAIYVCPICGHIEKFEINDNIRLKRVEGLKTLFDADMEKVKDYLNYDIIVDYKISCPCGCGCHMFEADDLKLAKILSMIIPYINTTMSCAGHVGIIYSNSPPDSNITEKEMFNSKPEIGLSGPWIDFNISTKDNFKIKKQAATNLFVEYVKSIIDDMKVNQYGIYNRFNIIPRNLDGDIVVRISCMDNAEFVKKYPEYLNILQQSFFDVITEAFQKLSTNCPNATM